MTELAKLKPLADWLGEVMASWGWTCSFCGEEAELMYWIEGQRYRWRALALIRKARRQRDSERARREVLVTGMRDMNQTINHHRETLRRVGNNEGEPWFGAVETMLHEREPWLFPGGKDDG